jgi:hypothetical protein
MDLATLRELIPFLRSQGVRAYEHDGLTIEFSPQQPPILVTERPAGTSVRPGPDMIPAGSDTTDGMVDLLFAHEGRI